jgi:hypothetical protein
MRAHRAIEGKSIGENGTNYLFERVSQQLAGAVQACLYGFCWVCAASGQPAVPPRSVMKSRRFRKPSVNLRNNLAKTTTSQSAGVTQYATAARTTAGRPRLEAIGLDQG